MYDFFVSDSTLFTNEISFLLQQKNKEEIIKLIKNKHDAENNEFIDLNTKRNDLIIWNAVLIREIIKEGSTKQFIHTLYNNFYNKILSANTLSELQNIETNFTNTYLDIMINSIEVTDNFITNKIIAYLYINLEEHISIDEMCLSLNISKGYLSRCFKKKMHISVMNYLKQIKIERAKVLLRNTDKTISEISSQLSFCDQSNFSRTFKHITGLTPTEYRNH